MRLSIAVVSFLALHVGCVLGKKKKGPNGKWFSSAHEHGFEGRDPSRRVDLCKYNERAWSLHHGSFKDTMNGCLDKFVEQHECGNIWGSSLCNGDVWNKTLEVRGHLWVDPAHCVKHCKHCLEQGISENAEHVYCKTRATMAVCEMEYGSDQPDPPGLSW